MTLETNQDYEAAFAEFSGKSATASEEQPAAVPAGDTPAETVEQTPERAPAAEAAPHSEPSQAAPEADSIEELRRKLAQAEHRERSASSRISARDRQANAIAQENARLKAQLEALQKPAATPAQAEQTEPDVLTDAADLEAAVNKRVLKHLAPLEERIKQADSRAAAAEIAAEEAAGFVRPLAADQEATAADQVRNHLDDNFGGWQAEVSHTNERFHGWLKGQPGAIRQLFSEGKTVADTSAVLTLYSAQTGHQFTRKAAAPSGQGAQRSASTSALRNAVGLQSRPGGSSARPDPNDFEGAFAEFSQKNRN